jgi:hypothetical protein
MRARSMVLAYACVVMLLCGLAEAVPLRLDLGIGPVSSGWTGVHSEKRFDKARNDPSAAAKTVIDIDGDGKTEEIYAGYNGGRRALSATAAATQLAPTGLRPTPRC